MDEAKTATGAPFHVRFWGVRGSVPTPLASHLGFGGNTPCVEVQTSSDDLIILDAGSGIHALGESLAGRGQAPSAIHIFFTHFHWDHIQGLPYFAPLYQAQSRIVFYSAHPAEELRSTLAAQMKTPFFPVDFNELSASIEYRQMSFAEPVRLDGLSFTCFPLHHPQGSVGFRIASAQKTVVYATDHEHGDSTIDAGLRQHSHGADVLIYDAQYTPREYESRRGWGHSTWLEAASVARDASVKQLVLFHHDPARDDQALRQVVSDAAQEFPAVCAAHESLEL